MAKYICSLCNYVYDEEKGCPDMGVKPGTKWEDVDESDFVCPSCGAVKVMFDKVDEDE